MARTADDVNAEIRTAITIAHPDQCRAALLRIFDQLYPPGRPDKDWSADDFEVISSVLLMVADGRPIP